MAASLVLRRLPSFCLRPRAPRSTMFRSHHRNGEPVGQHEQWDEEWREVGRTHGWELPPAAPWPLRLRGIRYVRAAVASVRLIRRHQRGSSLDCIPTGYSDWVIYAIARGWC